MCIRDSSHEHGGSQQIGARIAYNEIDMVLFFSDPQSNDLDADLKYITTLCDQYNICLLYTSVMELGLIENLQREDLNPIEEANGYKVLMSEHGLTQEEVAQRVGKSRPAVANALRLLTLPDLSLIHIW